MDQENYNKQYELAYHLTPELEGEDVLAKAEEISKIVTQNRGKIVNSHNPEKRHLSYPINLKHYANFGIIEFEAFGDALEKINAQMKLVSELMRYLIIHSITGKKVLKTIAQTTGKKKLKGKSGELSISGQARLSDKEKKERETVKPEEMEKQLEDVIEKL